VEQLGHYDPLRDPPAVSLDEARAKEWLQKGAKPTEAVLRILKWKGISEKVEGQ